MVEPIDIGSKEDGPELPDADDISPEERLQRLVLASLRDEYDPPVIEATVEGPLASKSPTASRSSEVSDSRGVGEPARRKWRRLDLFLALLIAGAAAGALLLLAIGRYDLDHDVSPASTNATALMHPTSQPVQVSRPPSPPEKAPGSPEAATEAGAGTIDPENPLLPAAPAPAASVPAAPVTASAVTATPVPAAPVPAPPSSRSLPPPAPVPARQTVDDWSSTIAVRPEASKPLPARRDVGTASRPLPVQPVTREPETGKPILWIYYAAGAEIAGENARVLATRTRRDVSNVDFLTQTEVPKIAVIRYSEEKNRLLSQEMAKTLAGLGYRWRIEDLSSLASTPHNMIEVWLPTNQDGRVAP